MTSYSPSETVQRSGFTLHTLRYYERIGLLDGVARTSAGRRAYTDDDLGRLEILRCLRETGMPIAQMLRYADLARSGDPDGSLRTALLQEHDRRIDEQVVNLREQQHHIRTKIEWYRSRA